MKTLFYTLFLSAFIISCSSETQNENSNHSNDNSETITAKWEKVSFKSSDDLDIVADFYPNKNADIVIILCHQNGSSRGEYLTIAPRLVQSGFECLAIDQRVGVEKREIPNETAINAKTMGMDPKFQDVTEDIEAAIKYVQERTDKKIVLMGSSYSATLVMMMGRDDSRIHKVVAFSPGIYFGSRTSLINAIKDYSKPVFVSCAKSETENVFAFVAPVGEKQLTFVEPEFEGKHGASHLWARNSSSDRIYTRLIQFLK